MRIISLLASVAMAVAACAPVPRQAQPASQAPALTTPATYTGELPCADCAGIGTTLNLNADGTFLLRQSYLGAPGSSARSHYDLGTWSQSADGRTLVLAGGGEAPGRFAVGGADTLRLLDTQGQEIRSSLNYELRRKPAVEPIRDTFRLAGLYTYMADAASLQECLTGRRFPVAPAGEALNLERAYLSARPSPGAPLFVTLDGHFDVLPGMEDGQRVESIVVDRFQRDWPGGSCKNRNPALPLLGTRWALTEIGGSTPPRAPGEQPWLEFQPEVGKVQGFGGCNRFTGRYELGAEGLRVKDLATTQMFCVNRMDVEQAFLGALSRAGGYRIDGVDLALTDRGETLAWLREGVASDAARPPASVPRVSP